MTIPVGVIIAWCLGWISPRWTVTIGVLVNSAALTKMVGDGMSGRVVIAVGAGGGAVGRRVVVRHDNKMASGKYWVLARVAG